VKIVIGSAFRNSTRDYVQVYMDRVVALRAALNGSTLRVHAVEGDSANNTVGYLREEAADRKLPLEVVTRDHGGPVFGSTEQPERMTALSHVGNGILEGVQDDDQVLFYVESDLVWSPDVILRLIDQLSPGRDVIAPMVFAGAAFYDIWGFRVNGHRFGSLPPYYASLSLSGLTPIDSAGSCLVMRAEVARRARMTTGALVEFCANARAAGFKIFCDGRERIYHP